MQYENPILHGFYPDPSICRVDSAAHSDYYLVTSSFGYFPGVPIFHSRDLIHWHQIGHVLTRLSQLPLPSLDDVSRGGIFAPTIRYHDGRFYVVTTNVSVGKHFYVTASDPAGPWSEPIWIDQRGIDPSLFFDDDGGIYFTWTTFDAILQSEIDIQTGALLTEPRPLWSGSGGRYPEGPHLYRANGRYYLLLAEGGTEYGHMVTVARSVSRWGPFEPCPCNPILTHRNRGSHQIQGTGHADLIQGQDGLWRIVFLGFRRPQEFSDYHHLGRETFLAAVNWDAEGWPVVNQNGTVEIAGEVPNLPAHTWPPGKLHEDFDDDVLALCMNSVGVLPAEAWSLAERRGWLRLNGTALTLDDPGSPVFVARRQQHFDCTAMALLDFSAAASGHEAGLTAYMNRQHHYEIAVVRQTDGPHVMLQRRIGDLSAVVLDHPVNALVLRLRIDATAASYTFSYSVTPDGADWVSLGSGAARYLSSEVAGGFTGVYFGMYATSNGKPTAAVADFDWFDYRPK